MLHRPHKGGKRPPIDCFLCGTRCPGQAAFAQHLTTHNLSDAYAATIAAQQAAGVESEARLHTAILHAPAPKPYASTFEPAPLDLPDDSEYTAYGMTISFGREGGSYAL